MSCCQPFEIKNPHFNQLGYPKHWKEYLEVPCGWCLNCRVDKLNWITDACEYEWKQYNYIGSFVTFTYDDIHLFKHSNILPEDFYSFRDDTGKEHVIPFINNKPAQYSLCRDDARDFLKRLRAKIDYYYKRHKINNCDLCRKDFKFIQTGEYGDMFGRPHYHFVFFGLDYNFCQEIFEDCWQQGLIDSKPIQDGAFRYVSDYFTKQLCGKRAVEVYDDNGLERPYFTHSLRLGKGLILEQLDFIMKHHGCYINNDDVLRPIPIYYKNVFHINTIDKQYKSIEEDMINHCIKPQEDPKNNVFRYSLKQMNEYKRSQCLLRHKKLEIKFNDAGREFEPLISYNVSSVNIDEILNNLFKDQMKDPNYRPKFTDFNKFAKACDELNIIPF